MVTSTKGTPGSFTRFVSSIARTIKSKFIPESQKATYTLSTPGHPGTATPGSSSPTSSSGISVTSGGGSSSGRRSGGSSGGGGSSASGGGSTLQDDVDYNYPGGDPIDQRPTQSTIASQISSNNAIEQKPVGVYVEEPGYRSGFYTETGEFYPTKNPEFAPKGYSSGLLQGFDPRTGIITFSSPASQEAQVSPKLIVDMGEQEPGLVQKAIGGYEKAESWASERITTPIFSAVSRASEKTFGVDVFSKEYQIAASPSLLGLGRVSFDFGSKNLGKINTGVKEFGGGISYGILEDVKTKPIKQAALVGVGYGVGFGVNVITGTASKIAPIVGTSTKVGVTIAGLGFGGVYAYGKGQEVMKAESSFEAGEIVGVTLKDISLVGYGARSGKKGYEQLSGWWRTRGREFIPLEQLTPQDIISGEKIFPTAPKGQHKYLFKSSIAGEKIGEPGGAFHVSPETFWGKGTIIPDTGTSEISGLYGSSYISPYFSGLKDSSGAYKIFSLGVGGDPGVAYIKPTGFRVSGFVMKSTPEFVGQKSVGGLFAWWKNPPKTGYADVPLMKTEIEAVFRPGTGSYGFESGKFFTRIEGIRIPIDVFGFAGGSTGAATGTATGGISLTGGASSYSLPPPSSVFSFTQLTALGLTNIKKEEPTSSRISDYTLPKTYSYSTPPERISYISSGKSSKRSGSLSYPISSSGSYPLSPLSFYPSYPISSSNILSPRSSLLSYKPPKPLLRSYKPLLPPGFLAGLRTRPSRGSGLLADFNPRYAASLTSRTFRLYGKVPERFLGGQVDPFGRRVIPRKRASKKHKRTTSNRKRQRKKKH